MSWLNAAETGAFKVDVATTVNGGHPPDFWAKRAAERIVQVSQGAHPAIREQALAFQKNIENVVLEHMKMAIRSDRTTVGHLVTEAGHPQLADLIRRA